MRDISEVALAEALVHWGAHEALRRFKSEALFDTADKLACLNFILYKRSPYIARLLAREPLSTFLASIEPGDMPSLLLADGRTVDDWIRTVCAAQDESYRHFCRLVEDPTISEGRLVCAAELIDPSAKQLGALMLYDGWHRIAAWVERVRSGRTSDIGVYLIVSRFPDPLFAPLANQPSNNSFESDALRPP